MSTDVINDLYACWSYIGVLEYHLFDTPQTEMVPDEEYVAREAEKEKEELKRKKEKITEKEKREIEKMARLLEKRQNTKDDPDMLPSLTLSDVSKVQ